MTTPPILRPVENRIYCYPGNEQRGSTLLFSLLLLTLMSLLGGGMMNAAIVEQQMAAHYRYSSQSHHAARAGLLQVVRALARGDSPALQGEWGGVDYQIDYTRQGEDILLNSHAIHGTTASESTLTAHFTINTDGTVKRRRWYYHD